MLRLAGQDAVVKISSQASIQHEARLHTIADATACPNLRRCCKDGEGRPLTGTVHGAGDGLHFLCLKGYFVGHVSKEHVQGASFMKVAEQVCWDEPLSDMEYCVL